MDIDAIERKLESGEAVVRGRCTGGDRWPDEPHYWVIDDLTLQKTFHVLVSEGPTWAHYEKKII